MFVCVQFFTFWLQLLQICFVWALLCLCFVQLCMHVYFLSKLERFEIIICSNIFSALLFSFLWQVSNENYKLSSIISQVSCFPALLFSLVLYIRSDLVKPTVLWPGSLLWPCCPLSDVESSQSIQLPFLFIFCLWHFLVPNCLLVTSFIFYPFALTICWEVVLFHLSQTGLGFSLTCFYSHCLQTSPNAAPFAVGMYWL